MGKLHNSKLTSISKTLRRNMTKEERKLWYDFLRHLSVMVHRQKVIGNYVVDFYVAREKLVIEIDGSQHFEKEGIAADGVRDRYFRSHGLSVLRYSNADINYRFQSVCEDILNHLSQDVVVDIEP